MSSFPNQAYRTYLPVLRDPELYYLLRDQDYEGLQKQLQPIYSYERVGLDRLLAILIDLGQMQISPPARVLDIGCNTGLFTLGLTARGFDVVGVDSNIAAEVQGFYPGSILSLARQQAAAFRKQAVFIEGEVADFLAHNDETFDVCLLLSVVHQWLDGYATSGQGRMSVSQVKETLAKLTPHISRAIYYEAPDDELASSLETPALLQWLYQASLAKEATPIAVSAAANGEIRTLYRIIL